MIEHILITGCSQGLGRSLALRFSDLGCYVYAVGRDRKKMLALSESNPNIYPIVADITSSKDRDTIYELMKGKSFSIIHNAGIADPSSFEKLSESVLRAHFETNAIAPILLTQRLIPLLKAGQRILNINSGAATMPLPGLFHYCITKATMQHAMVCLNKELSPLNIYCGNVRPGLMDTAMITNWLNVDITRLPSKDFYVQQKRDSKLIAPELAAVFVSWVMLDTTDSEFSETAWSIYDTTYQHRWSPDSKTASFLSAKL